MVIEVARGELKFVAFSSSFTGINPKILKSFKSNWYIFPLSSTVKQESLIFPYSLNAIPFIEEQWDVECRI